MGGGNSVDKGFKGVKSVIRVGFGDYVGLVADGCDGADIDIADVITFHIDDGSDLGYCDELFYVLNEIKPVG